MTGTGELERDLQRWQHADAPVIVTTVIPYTRFLERRAWRAKIAADFRLLADRNPLASVGHDGGLALPLLPPRD